MSNIDSANTERSLPAAFGGGAVIGTLGGIIGLGGAEFRLPLLIGPFRFAALEAVILNKAMSLVVVATALPFRAGTVPFGEIVTHWPIILNLLAGSLAGAWFGASWATRLKSETLYKVLAGLLVMIAIILLFGHEAASTESVLTGTAQMIAGVIAGFGIGIVASLMGVAGGVVAQLGLRPSSPLSAFSSGDAEDLGRAEGREAVHEGDAGVDLGGLAVGVS